MSEWISVNERWPSDDDGYDDDKLVVKENLSTGKRIVIIMDFTQWTNKEYAKGFSGLEQKDFWKITHWMPLPEPPK